MDPQDTSSQAEGAAVESQQHAPLGTNGTRSHQEQEDLILRQELIIRGQQAQLRRLQGRQSQRELIELQDLELRGQWAQNRRHERRTAVLQAVTDRQLTTIEEMLGEVGALRRRIRQDGATIRELQQQRDEPALHYEQHNTTTLEVRLEAPETNERLLAGLQMANGRLETLADGQVDIVGQLERVNAHLRADAERHHHEMSRIIDQNAQLSGVIQRLVDEIHQVRLQLNNAGLG